MQISYYPKEVMHYLQTLPNSGVLPIESSSVIWGQDGDVSKGLKIRLYLDVDNGTIKDLRYLVYGNGYFVAAVAKISEVLRGLTLKQAANYNFNKLYENLGIPANKINDFKVITKLLNNIILQYKGK